MNNQQLQDARAALNDLRKVTGVEPGMLTKEMEIIQGKERAHEYFKFPDLKMAEALELLRVFDVPMLAALIVALGDDIEKFVVLKEYMKKFLGSWEEIQEIVAVLKKEEPKIKKTKPQKRRAI